MSPRSQLSIDASVRASIPILGKLPSPALSISNLMPHSAEDLSQVAKVDKKDKVFLDKMVKVITKLETKYQTPTHKRKKTLFTRKQKSSPVVHKELATIYHCLAAPEPGAVTVPEPFPRVNWNLVEFKPVLPPRAVSYLFLLTVPRVLPGQEIPSTFKPWPPTHLVPYLDSTHWELLLFLQHLWVVMCIARTVRSG